MKAACVQINIYIYIFLLCYNPKLQPAVMTYYYYCLHFFFLAAAAASTTTMTIQRPTTFCGLLVVGVALLSACRISDFAFDKILDIFHQFECFVIGHMSGVLGDHRVFVRTHWEVTHPGRVHRADYRCERRHLIDLGCGPPPQNDFFTENKTEHIGAEDGDEPGTDNRGEEAQPVRDEGEEDSVDNIQQHNGVDDSEDDPADERCVQTRGVHPRRVSTTEGVFDDGLQVECDSTVFHEEK